MFAITGAVVRIVAINGEVQLLGFLGTSMLKKCFSELADHIQKRRHLPSVDRDAFQISWASEVTESTAVLMTVSSVAVGLAVVVPPVNPAIGEKTMVIIAPCAARASQERSKAALVENPGRPKTIQE
jgi:hypothetical protein